MRKCKFLLFLLLGSGFVWNAGAQGFYQNNMLWEEEWTNFDPHKTEYPETTTTLPKMITTDTYLTNDKVYLISGDVHVAFGATLTIQEGTILRGDDKKPGTLLIGQGSNIIASGTKESPIIFTSNRSSLFRKSGDWGGIVIVEDKKVQSLVNNLKIKETATTDLEKTKQSKLEFVRVEFAGNRYAKVPGNSVAIYGMDSSSNYNHIMVSYSDSDSFGLYGGKGKLNNLISLKTNDDDYQISHGFNGELSNVLAVRHPLNTVSYETSFALEIDGGNKNVNQGDKKSNVILTDASFVNLSTKDMVDMTTSAISVSNVAGIDIKNSLISGFSDVVEFDSSYTSSQLVENNFKMESSFFNIHGKGFKVSDKSIDRLSILKYNTFTEDFANSDQLFKDPLNIGKPQFGLNQGESMYTIIVPEE